MTLCSSDSPDLTTRLLALFPALAVFFACYTKSLILGMRLTTVICSTSFGKGAHGHHSLHLDHLRRHEEEGVFIQVLP